MSGGKLEQLVAGGRKPVDVRSIESELAAIWRSASHSGMGQDAEAVVRACLWNVVVHTVDGTAADEAQEDLAQLSLTLPSRAILIRTDTAAAEDGIDAWIAANCRLTEDGRRHVCCEEIIVTARGRTMSDLPALVRALLAPDVPSALVWMEDPSLAGRHLPDWCESVDRFVFDSARFDDLSEFAYLLRSLEGMPRRPQLGDLNWRRIRPWRALMARLYDQPELREAFASAERIVAAGDAATMPYAAALLLGWLASRTGGSAGPRALIGADGREARVEFEEARGEPHLGGLDRVRFESPGRSMELFRSGGHLDMRDHNVESLPEALRCAAPVRTRISLLAEELEDYGGDPLLPAAMPHAAALLE